MDIDKRDGSHEPEPLSDFDRFTYYGYKFEQICTEEAPGQQQQQQGDEEGDVDPTSEVRVNASFPILQLPASRGGLGFRFWSSV